MYGNRRSMGPAKVPVPICSIPIERMQFLVLWFCLHPYYTPVKKICRFFSGAFSVFSTFFVEILLLAPGFDAFDDGDRKQSPQQEVGQQDPVIGIR